MYVHIQADRMIEMGRDDPLSYRSVIMVSHKAPFLF